MFDVGFSELLMIGLVSLLVIGPERLPKVARVVGFWLGKMRAISANLRAEIHHELQLEEMKQIMQEQQALFEQQMREQQHQFHAVENDLEHLSDLEHSAVENPPEPSLVKEGSEVQLTKSADEAR
jgi:sec-independent protein translocase protein TatB